MKLSRRNREKAAKLADAKVPRVSKYAAKLGRGTAVADPDSPFAVLAKLKDDGQ